jgi:predicted metal-dependent hydrolase
VWLENATADGHAIGEGETAVAAGEAGPPRRLHVGLAHGVSPERLRDVVQSWLQREARRLFEARATHFAERLGVRVTRLTLSSANTRWGSANASGAIRLHWRLIQYPLATIDYVVAHELAHLREMNHGPRFWEVVGSVVPDYRAARRQLGSEPLAAWD